jgi:hypothetical protein
MKNKNSYAKIEVDNEAVNELHKLAEKYSNIATRIIINSISKTMDMSHLCVDRLEFDLYPEKGSIQIYHCFVNHIDNSMQPFLNKNTETIDFNWLYNMTRVFENGKNNTVTSSYCFDIPLSVSYKNYDYSCKDKKSEARNKFNEYIKTLTEKFETESNIYFKLKRLRFINPNLSFNTRELYESAR